MNSYNKIRNPKTGRLVRINGKIGKKIIKNYYHFMAGGSVPMKEEITFTMYYAPWCGHCTVAKTPFKELMKYTNDNLINGKHIKSNMVNCEENKDIAQKEQITAYPTFKLNTHHGEKKYNGQRDLESFKQFLKTEIQ